MTSILGRYLISLSIYIVVFLNCNEISFGTFIGRDQTMKYVLFHFSIFCTLHTNFTFHVFLVAYRLNSLFLFSSALLPKTYNFNMMVMACVAIILLPSSLHFKVQNFLYYFMLLFHQN